MNLLSNLAALQITRNLEILGVAALLTVFMAAGVPRIELQTDFQASLPDDLPPIEAEDRVEAQFGSSDAIIILFEVNDEPREPSFVDDVRDPRLLESQQFLERELERESAVASARSPSDLFRDIPGSRDEVIQRLQQVPGASAFFNRDYTSSVMFVQLEDETTEENVRESTRMIEENLEQTPKYPGVDITVSGLPVVRNDLSNVLVSDSATTTSVAALFILGLLTLVRGRVYGPVTFVPLLVGLVWTLGALGWFGIPLTIATIALGSLILGLGVEYGSFMTERILEESEKHGLEEGVGSAVSSTGKAILGSATTTVVGFGALILASISFIRDLGVTLALGISLTLAAAIVVTPALIVTWKRWRA